MQVGRSTQLRRIQCNSSEFTVPHHGSSTSFLRLLHLFTVKRCVAIPKQRDERLRQTATCVPSPQLHKTTADRRHVRRNGATSQTLIRRCSIANCRGTRRPRLRVPQPVRQAAGSLVFRASRRQIMDHSSIARPMPAFHRRPRLTARSAMLRTPVWRGTPQYTRPRSCWSTRRSHRQSASAVQRACLRYSDSPALVDH